MKEYAKDQIPFKQMTTAQKLSVIRQYYLLPGIVILALAIGLIYVFYSSLTHKDPLITVLMVDQPDVNDRTVDELVEDFAAETGLDKDLCEVGTIAVGEYEKGGGANSNLGMALSVKLQSGSQDILIIPESTFMEYAVYGYFQDLKQYVPQDRQEELIHVEQEDDIDGKKYDPLDCGIHLRDLGILPSTDYYDDAVLAIVAEAKNQENDIAFIQYLYEKK